LWNYGETDDSWRYVLTYADVPATARKVRVGFTVLNGVDNSSPVHFTNISLRLVGRAVPQASVRNYGDSAFIFPLLVMTSFVYLADHVRCFQDAD
jgi:hypothetical protein